MTAAPLVIGQTVLLDCDDSPHGTWRRGERATVAGVEGRYWLVRIERTGVALVFDRRELLAVPATADRGAALVALLLAGCVVGALLALFVLAGQHVMCSAHDDALAYCNDHTPTSTQETPR